MNLDDAKNPRGSTSRRASFTLHSSLFTLFLLGLPAVSFAQAASALDSGDTAWMLVATALVLFMTIPGLALFYGGLVRAKNVLSVLMQCFAITCLVSILWLAGVYSLVFDSGSGFIGGISKIFLFQIGRTAQNGSIPEALFFMFQMTFAIITPALIIGAFAERMKFSAVLLFMGLWLVLVYAPIAHWVWGPDGWLNQMGALDFAGGMVVHISAGVAGLICALVLGKRKGYPQTPMPPHSMTLCVVGASMLWVGWFGFNAGSAVAANGVAGMAMVATHLAGAAAALSWMFMEWIKHGKPSVLGVVSGAVAGLATITPASGFVGPVGALGIGIAAGIACQWGATSLKRRFGYDDALDVFGVHGVGGFIGVILTGVFASPLLGGFQQGMTFARQLPVQFLGAVSTLAYSALLTFLILKVVNVLIGLRVSHEAETEGLDVSLHDERGYNF
jgi:Amt family ammonium transporter